MHRGTTLWQGAAAIACAVMLTACSAAGDAPAALDPGPRETRTVAGAGFTRIASTGPDRVVVRFGREFAVTVAARRALFDRLDVRVDGDTLRVARKANLAPVDEDALGTALVTVTMPRLAGVSVTGSGDFDAERIDGDAAELRLTGSGDLTVRDGVVGRVAIDLSGSGDMRLTGRAQRAEVALVGSGDISAPTFGADRADISVAGSGDVALSVSETADVSVVGSGNVTVTGGGRCAVNRRGSGTVNCN